jgi:transposase
MNIRKITQNSSKGKRPSVQGPDHLVTVDWSLRIMAIAHMTRRMNEPTVFERASDIKFLKEYLDGLHGRVIVAFEETTTAQWLYLELIDHADEIIVCDPYRNRLLTDGPKTDKIDACKLCLLLRAGLLKPVFHSGGKIYELRHLVSAYDDLVKAGVRAQNQLTALKHGHGDTGTSAPFILEHLTKGIELYRLSKEEYEAKFEELATRNTLTRILLDITGIGSIGAVKIVAIVVDAHRFPRAGHYLSYCGLVHNEKISGGRSYGRRKPRFNHTLKTVYKLAAMSALSGTDNPMRAYYDYLLAKGVAEHHARHALARYIAG